jgi:hypothetical protein
MIRRLTLIERRRIDENEGCWADARFQSTASTYWYGTDGAYPYSGGVHTPM